MGFMDKVKAQATSVAQKAQEGVKAGQAKLDDAQAKKCTDALLRDLGAQVYAEKTGNASGETAAEIERLLAELRAMEEEHGAIATAPTADQAAPPALAAPAVPAAGTASTESASYSLDDL